MFISKTQWKEAKEQISKLKEDLNASEQEVDALWHDNSKLIKQVQDFQTELCFHVMLSEKYMAEKSRSCTEISTLTRRVYELEQTRMANRKKIAYLQSRVKELQRQKEYLANSLGDLPTCNMKTILEAYEESREDRICEKGAGMLGALFAVRDFYGS